MPWLLKAHWDSDCPKERRSELHEPEYEADYLKLQKAAGEEPMFLAWHEVHKYHYVPNPGSMIFLPGMRIGWRSSLFLRVLPDGYGGLLSVGAHERPLEPIFEGSSWSLRDSVRSALGFLPEGARRLVVHEVSGSDLALKDLLVAEKGLGKDLMADLALNGYLRRRRLGV
jgi:hypothetical protein